MKNILILIGGWHFPFEFYKQISELTIPENSITNKYVVSHRNLELPIVYDEKINFIKNNPVNKLDISLYNKRLTLQNLKEWNIEYKEYENIIGDFYFISQYFEDHVEIPDYLFFFHDDNFILNKNLISDIVNNNVPTYFNKQGGKIVEIKNDDWLHIGNCFYEDRFIPRGSFNVFKKELLLEKDKYFKFDNVDLNRTNKIDSPDPNNILELRPWDRVCRNFGEYMTSNNLTHRSYRLSTVRRQSKYLLECQRGFLRSLT